MTDMAEKCRDIDVICQHKTNGSIIPIKIRMQDDDGEFQIYTIRSYKVIEKDGRHILPNHTGVGGHMWEFECAIANFGREKRIRLFYNAYDGRWIITWN